MVDVYLSHISYVHGDPRPLAALGEAGCADEALRADLLENYRASTASALHMAVDAATRTVLASDARPDLILYATDTADGHSMLEAGRHLAAELGLPSTVALGVAGHGCGNFGALLQIADGFVATDQADAILLVASDRAVDRPRMMPSGVSVLSDGAAAVMAARRPAAGARNFALRGVAMKSDARGETAANTPAAQLRTVHLARAAFDGLHRRTGLQPSHYQHAIFNNFRASSQRFLAAAAGFTENQLILAPVSEFGHCFAIDTIVTLELLASRSRFAQGDRLALSATGPRSWTAFDVEAVG